jgi:hypothetical protein
MRGQRTQVSAWAIVFLVGAALSAQAQVVAPAAAPDFYVPPPPVYPQLGIYGQPQYIGTAYGWELGVRVLSVTPGMPAWGRLDPGDVIFRVNGRRVYSVPDLTNALAYSGGGAFLRVLDVRTNMIRDLPPIYLGGPAGPAAAAAVAGPAAAASVEAGAPTGLPDPGVPVGIPAPGAPTTVPPIPGTTAPLPAPGPGLPGAPGAPAAALPVGRP